MVRVPIFQSQSLSFTFVLKGKRLCWTILSFEKEEKTSIYILFFYWAVVELLLTAPNYESTSQGGLINK